MCIEEILCKFLSMVTVCESCWSIISFVTLDFAQLMGQSHGAMCWVCDGITQTRLEITDIHRLSWMYWVPFESQMTCQWLKQEMERLVFCYRIAGFCPLCDYPLPGCWWYWIWVNDLRGRFMASVYPWCRHVWLVLKELWHIEITVMEGRQGTSV